MSSNLMKTATSAALAVTIAAFALPTFAKGEGQYPECNVSYEAFEDHIYPRHCNLEIFTGKSKFVADYCNDVSSAQDFCEMAQTATHKSVVVQSDGRIRYDAEFDVEVGIHGEMCGRMVMESNGSVVTQFPQAC